MSNDTASVEWESLRTDESRHVEEVLRQRFKQVDAYRYNSASIRVRIVDDQFKGLSREERDDIVEPILSTLERDILSDIMNVVFTYSGEEKESFRAQIHNLEFEHPSKSML